MKKTDYDKLVLEIWTKRNIKPTEALRVASDIMIEHFKIIGSDLDQVEGIDSAIELGHCFKLGTRYSEPVGIHYHGEDGALHPVVLGSYGIGLERLMAVAIEAHYDDWGDKAKYPIASVPPEER